MILCRRGSAESALHHLREIMGKLQLTVNEEKTRICRVPNGEFDFLGYTFGRMYSPETGHLRELSAMDSEILGAVCGLEAAACSLLLPLLHRWLHGSANALNSGFVTRSACERPRSVAGARLTKNRTSTL